VVVQQVADHVFGVGDMTGLLLNRGILLELVQRAEGEAADLTADAGSRSARYSPEVPPSHPPSPLLLP
jgi:hypothetical protein